MKFKKMTKSIVSGLTALMIIAGNMTSPISAEDKTTAFPGAEGGGMYATGARGAQNQEIYHVTNLNDSGSGSFRDAVSESNRIIVFDVAGNIELVNALNITGSNLTILGQTAPGDGICIKNNTTGIYGDNIILRYLRFRMGDQLTIEDDSIGGRGHKNIIIDHCSISWSVDECASFYDNTNFTMQWCIIAQSLKESVHDKGSHGYGGIWGGENTSYHHNLIAHHDSRNPRIATAGIEAAQTDVTKQTDLTDLRNNVIYNWGGNSAYGGENGAPVNIINCYYKYGPSTSSSKRERIFQISAKKEGDNSGTNNLNCPGWGTDLYVSGNYVYGSAAITADNTKGVDFDSNTKTYGLWTDETITDEEKIVHNRYINDYPVTTDTAEDAYKKVLSGAGASISRDAVDEQLINDVKNGTGSLINTPSEAGGYPELNGVKAKDSDNDGIPNEWEDKNGLDKFDKSDALQISSEGYTNLEIYANALADGSYVRDTSYDPDVPDYDPSADATPAPDTTPEPEKKLVNQWIAADGDEKKAAGTEFMPGLTALIELSSKKNDQVTFEDGEVFNFAITSSTNGSLKNGKVSGNVLRYEAPQDGVFTIYGYTVSGTKTFYVIKEDAGALTEAYSKEYTGSSIPVKYSVDVKKGDIYYFFIDGSKMRFCSAKLEEYVESPTPVPTTPPTDTPTLQPTTAPTSQPTTAPTSQPTDEPDTNPIIKSVSAKVDNGEIAVSFTVENMPNGQKYIVAGYENGHLKSMTVTDSTETKLASEGVTKVKVFAWNSISEMEPLCSAGWTVVQ